MNDYNEIIDTTTTPFDIINNNSSFYYSTSTASFYIIDDNNSIATNEDYTSIYQYKNITNSNNNDDVAVTAIICKDVYSPNAASYEDEYEFWWYGIILNLIGIIGIFGNILSMVILSRPQMRSSINYLLIGLARCDTVLIITSMLLFGFRSIYPYSGYLFYYYYYIYPQIAQYIFPLATASQTASIYLTLTVSLERYVAVCHPLRARALCTYGRAKIYVIICIIFAILFNLVKLWEAKLLIDENSEYGIIFCVTSTELRKNSMYITIYIHWCYLIVNYFIPFLGLSVFNLLIYNQVRKANRERQRLSRSEKREIGLATMLLCVVIAFFLFNLLALYVNIREAFFDIIDDYAIVISNLLVTLNSSVNFIIYVIFGEKFKRIFLLLFCKNRIGRESPDGLMPDDSSCSNGDGLGGGGGGHGGMYRGASGRFSRHGTLRTQTTSINGNSSHIKISRSIRLTRAPSPGPIVYYPATRDSSMSRTTSLKLNHFNNCNNNNVNIENKNINNNTIKNDNNNNNINNNNENNENNNNNSNIININNNNSNNNLVNNTDNDLYNWDRKTNSTTGF